VGRWEEHADVPAAFRPQALWPEAKTVVVLGLPIPLPMLETTPSIIYTTLYNTANTELDQLAYQLCRILNAGGYASIFMPRDGYGHISVLVDKPVAAFSQVYAAKYAGLGTVGYHHMLLTPEYGPRVRFVSVLTTLKLTGSPLITDGLCSRCMLCATRCPTQALAIEKGRTIAEMDKRACALYHVQLCEELRFPCGVCAKVCPTGRDRVLYGREETSPARQANPAGVKRRRLEHFRTYGSKPQESKRQQEGEPATRP
jgi:epoxyqueuosine reductase QueG